MVVRTVVERAIPGIVHVGDFSQLDPVRDDGGGSDRPQAPPPGAAPALPGVGLSVGACAVRFGGFGPAFFYFPNIAPRIGAGAGVDPGRFTLLFSLEKEEERVSEEAGSPGTLAR